MHDSVARAVATSAIWAAIALFLSVCAWRADWSSPVGLGFLISFAFIVSGAAVAATSIVWKSGRGSFRLSDTSQASRLAA